MAVGRLDSSLEAAGAEFLVLGHLLIEGIQAYKAYTNFPGYDLIATHPESNRACRIQVKSRWATDFNGAFLVRNFDCDFVVMVALNRGYRYGRKGSPEDTGHRSPQFYVVPTAVVERSQDPSSFLGRVFLRRIDGWKTYEDNWALVKEFLSIEGGQASTAALRS